MPPMEQTRSGVECVAALIGRADLSDEELRSAIAERLAADGRTSPDPDIVLEAARLKKRKAVAFLRTLVLPQPRAGLTMPIQPILRSHGTGGVGSAHG